ncbi:MAG: mitotic spindle checkpoint protein Bub3 [Amphiamblys sp. WSBS2006]|nr:MAG: mitotic spindle checkpoint protein Bub3 [Amphiamblys sp. WSBS2006]
MKHHTENERQPRGAKTEHKAQKENTHKGRMDDRAELKPGARDGITRSVFSTHSPELLYCSSWDKDVRVYDTEKSTLRGHATVGSPVLDIAVDKGTLSVFCGCLDGSVVEIDGAAMEERTIGKHLGGVKGVAQVESRVFATGGWDKKFCLWDARAQSAQSVFDLPKKVYSIDAACEMVVVGMAERAVYLFDVRRLDRPYQKRESSLRSQTRSVRLFHDAGGFVTSSIDGRVSVDYIDDAQTPRCYAFKCHWETITQNSERVALVHPVHALCLDAAGQLATGGGDGKVYLWNIHTKKRVSEFMRYPSSISSLCFSGDSSRLAVASSYCFEEGEKEHGPDQVYIQQIHK